MDAYTFSVVRTDECPISVEMVLTSTPLLSPMVANECLDIWKWREKGSFTLSPNVFNEVLMVLFLEFRVSLSFSQSPKSNSSSNSPNTKFSFLPFHFSKIFNPSSEWMKSSLSRPFHSRSRPRLSDPACRHSRPQGRTLPWR